MAISRVRIEVTGQVQGVGFRPFVYRLAVALRLEGLVANDAGGAHIEVQGPAGTVEEFIVQLRTQLPPLARIDTLRRHDLPSRPAVGQFAIAPSAGGELADAQVTVDTAVCADCLREMRDPADRRFGYPFINCTNCGPRYSIVQGIPYDRPNTTMAAFAMCERCQAEYSNPADRRYHAQPIACPVCGPRAWLCGPDGSPMAAEDPIAEAARLLERGLIVAIKGLGGFQLAVRADDDDAVERLRRRKARQAKPFALMAPNLAAACTLADVSPEAQRELASPRGPIVLCPAKPGAHVAPSVAPGTGMLGIMLPTTPLHHLLMDHSPAALVMTSGNLAEEPLVAGNDEALERLGPIADAMLMHDRPIARAIDDSVAMPDATGAMAPVRRARGYAPQPLRLPRAPHGAPVVLAAGADLKNTFCLLRGQDLLVSEHVGDLADARTFRHYLRKIADLQALYDVRPGLLACDLHPRYVSVAHAHRLASEHGLPLVGVQHHFAHIVGVLAEHGREGPVIGIAADGTGYGPDGAIWGCEVLRVDIRDYKRLGRLRYFDLPGGEQAAIETHRPAVSVLLASGQAPELPAEATGGPSPQAVAAVAAMLRQRVSCVPSSSLGRLFDACAALCGVAAANRFEAQAPVALEWAADKSVCDSYEWKLSEGEPFEIDFAGLVGGLCDDRRRGVDVPTMAARAHNTIAGFLAAGARRARELTGLSSVALSGGCFANRLLTARLRANLVRDGFEVLTHRLLPVGDGGVCVGQAVVAAGRWCAGLADGE